MDNQSLQPPKGFRDFLPKDLKKRQYAFDIIKHTFESFGFEPIETPALEYQEVLLGKYGSDADKLIYKFQDLGGRGVALRYDQTVPTSRILAKYHQDLPMPWRRYQIQPVWRAENTQAGRFREFLQCDADIYGTVSPLADAEVIALSDSIYKNLGFKDYQIFINDRKNLFELMKYSNIPEPLHLNAISAIDKLDRKSVEEVSADLKNVGISEESIKHLFHHLEEEKPSDELKKIMEFSNSLGVLSEKLIFQARLARGLDYYTGTIFEIKAKDYKSGSLLGGGRYDNLISKLSGVDIPAVGFAVGFDRTLEAMEQTGLFPSDKKRSGVLVSIFSPDLKVNSIDLVTNLRQNSIKAEIYMDESAKLDKQIKYADKKGIRWLIVIGPEEVQKDGVILKDLETGHQEDIKLKDLIEKVASFDK